MMNMDYLSKIEAMAKRSEHNKKSSNTPHQDANTSAGYQNLPRTYDGDSSKEQHDR